MTSTATTSNTWPWMKGEGFCTDAIDPVTPDDDRPSVADLIQKHRKDIDAVRAILQAEEPLFVPTKHDDLWLVRFLLSHKKVKEAAAAAKTSIQFRHQYHLDEQDLRFSPDLNQLPDDEGWKKLSSNSQPGAYSFTLPDASRGPLAYMQFADIDQNGLAKLIKDDEMFQSMLHVTEWSFQWCDHVTRTTGRLTKQARIVGLKNFKFLKMLNLEFMSRQGEATKKIEDCYPQLLGSLFLCDPPTWIDVPWTLVRPFLPKRVVAKTDFVKPNEKEKDLKKMYRFLTKENLPQRYGGASTLWPLPKLPEGCGAEPETAEEIETEIMT
ncbi:expressed unknown protein [Seminavis robusta]|uniref:CRAL-TRIO domain-containing protein n=1 Tax=Seminavis robusta TaxID=568900 RepID=A0A9N8H7J8_9STRA|nr:expressed unknown protein [Seminavis robusta]|eukprot:Sro69_g038721.1  (324) ;mRNA; f:128944-129915